MGKIISVASFEEMERTARKLTQIAEDYRGIYTQLMKDVSTMGEAYKGADNLAFVEQITGFTKELEAMAEKIRTTGEVINQQRMNYVKQQEANIVQVKKLTN